MDSGSKRGAGLRCLGWEGYASGSLPEAFQRACGIVLSGADHLGDDAACRKILAERDAWDIININTPFVRDVLYPAGAIAPADERYRGAVNSVSGPLSRFHAAVLGPDDVLLGVPQRFGPFNLVINSERVAAPTARKDGFSLALDPYFRGRFGVLAYEDFNVMHIAIAAGLDPFQAMDDAELIRFRAAAMNVLQAAAMVTDDHNAMNEALVRGEIDFYISGGVYTASPARLEGHLQVQAITPQGGPIAGKGAVAFVEVNALVAGGRAPRPERCAFLDFILSPDGAYRAAKAAGACNPVVQMHDRRVREQFSAHELTAMQWDSIEEDLAYCADYAIIPSYRQLAEIVRASRSAQGKA